MSEHAAKNVPVNLLSELLGDIRPNVFYPSLFIGFLLMVILSEKAFQQFPITRAQFPLLNFITRYILDVAVIQAVTTLILGYLLYKYLKYVSNVSSLVIIVFLCSLFAVIFGLELAAEETFLKPSFHYGPPPGSLPECFITSIVMKYFGLARNEGIVAPSGFVMRQTILLLLFLSLSHQLRWREIVASRKLRRTLHVIHYGLFILVLLLRFYRGRHTFFDIGIAIGVTVVLYWYGVTCITFLLRDTAENRGFLADLLMPLSCYSFAILFYCQETKWWMWTSVALWSLLGLLYLSRSGRPTALES